MRRELNFEDLEELEGLCLDEDENSTVEEFFKNKNGRAGSVLRQESEIYNMLEKRQKRKGTKKKEPVKTEIEEFFVKGVKLITVELPHGKIMRMIDIEMAEIPIETIRKELAGDEASEKDCPFYMACQKIRKVARFREPACANNCEALDLPDKLFDPVKKEFADESGIRSAIAFGTIKVYCDCVAVVIKNAAPIYRVNRINLGTKCHPWRFVSAPKAIPAKKTPTLRKIKKPPEKKADYLMKLDGSRRLLKNKTLKEAVGWVKKFQKKATGTIRLYELIEEGGAITEKKINKA